MKYLLIIGGIAAAMLAACSGDAPAKETPQTVEKTAANSEFIELSAEQVKTSGVSWAALDEKTGAGGFSVTGELRVHNENIATLSALADGVVVELRTGLNKSVRQGEVLAIIQHPALLDLQQEYLETKDRLLFLQAEYERYKTLRDDNATALKNYQKAESEWREAQTRRDLLAAKLRLFHIDPDKLQAATAKGTFALTAPVSGVVTRTLVTQGSAVQTGTPVCEIVDMRKIHADLFVFEKDLGSVRNGQTVQLKIAGNTTRSYAATVFSIDPTVDPERKAVRVHAQLRQTPAETLVNGAYVDGHIETGSNAPLHPALPADAVVREGEENFVFLFVREAEGKVFFKKIPVHTEPAADGYLQIQSPENLPADGLYVQKGAYYVSAQGAGVEAEE